MKIADFSIKHPAIITILLVTTLLFGGLALGSLKQELFPPIQFPTVFIMTTYPGVGPEDMEEQVTSVIEDQVSSLSGVTSIRSESEESVSIITIEFDYGENIDLRLPELRELLNGAQNQLPAGISGPPVIFKMATNSMSILSVALESDIEKNVLSRFAEDEVAPFLSKVSGVSNVRIHGKEEQVLEIRLQLSRLESKGIPVLDVYELLRYQNISFPAGSAIYKSNELQVRMVGEFSSIEEIENMVVGYRDNTYIRLKDVAVVSIVKADPDTYTFDGRDEILLIDVFKQTGEDSARIIRRVKGILEEIEGENNGVITFNIISDESRDIRLSMSSVRSAAVFGALLAVLILFIFLHNTRTTVIIGISIPLSILIAFIFMYINGQSLNLMTMGALTLAIGMIVDASIVVLENIHRHFENGLSRKEAASMGTAEVGGAVIASTTTSVSVFLPILFTRGLVGITLKDVAWTVIYALTAAMLVAVVVVPFLSSLMLKHESPGHPVSKRLAGASEGSIRRLSRGYRRALSWTLDNRVFVMISAVVLLGVSILAVDFLGFEFIPSTDMNEMLMEMETPPGYTLEQTREKTAEVDRRIRELVPELEAAVYYVGQGDGMGLSKAKNGTFGRLKLVEKSERSRSVHRIIRLLQQTLPAEIPDIDITLKNGGLDSLLAIVTGGAGFMIELSGNDMEALVRAGESIRNLMKQDPNIMKTEMSVGYDRQEIITDLSLDYMGNLGLTPYEAAITGRIVFNGMETGVYRGLDDSMDMVLNSDVTGRKITSDILNTLALKSRTGHFVSFSSFSDLRTEPALSAIHHKNRMPTLVVTGYLAERNVRETSERLLKAMNDLILPPGITWSTAGSIAEMVASFITLLYALGISVFLVYMVMVIQFERFVQPLIVMAAVPFTFIGVVGSLLVYNTTLNVVSFMGIIALGGIVVNNAIVMIDYTNLVRSRDSLKIREAVIEGASSRLKPILITTLTTVLGVIPMAAGFGEGAEIYAPLGQAISGGLVSSTFITLFLVPVLYYTVETRAERRKQ